MGGIVLIRCMQPIDVVALPVPAELIVVLVRPEQQMRTAEARAVLPADVPLEVALHQAAQVGAMVAALATRRLRAAGPRDRRPDRRAGARGTAARASPRPRRRRSPPARSGSSISGSGPTAFALVRGRETGERVAAAMAAAYRDEGIRSEARVAPVDREGARLIDESTEERRMKFRTQRPDSWQVCLACGNEMTELDPHPRCAACGGLLEVQHRPPRR